MTGWGCTPPASQVRSRCCSCPCTPSGRWSTASSRSAPCSRANRTRCSTSIRSAARSGWFPSRSWPAPTAGRRCPRRPRCATGSCWCGGATQNPAERQRLRRYVSNRYAVKGSSQPLPKARCMVPAAGSNTTGKHLHGAWSVRVAEQEGVGDRVRGSLQVIDRIRKAAHGQQRANALAGCSTDRLAALPGVAGGPDQAIFDHGQLLNDACAARQAGPWAAGAERSCVARASAGRATRARVDSRSGRCPTSDHSG